jgi:hypothetical protein
MVKQYCSKNKVRAKVVGNAAYSMRRALIESVDGGSDVYLSSGIVTRVPHPVNAGQFVVNDARTFEGWKHEN